MKLAEGAECTPMAGNHDFELITGHKYNDRQSCLHESLSHLKKQANKKLGYDRKPSIIHLCHSAFIISNLNENKC